MSSNLLPPGQVNRRSVSCSRAQFFPDPKPTRPKAGEPQPIRALPQIHRVNGLQGGKSQYNPQNLGYGPRQSSSCYANFGKATADLTPKGRQPRQGHSPADQPPKGSVAEWGVRTLRQACCQEIPGSAMCVQNFDDSRGLAIRITYRISLRSSSLWEPRHPLLKVVMSLVFQGAAEGCSSAHSRFRYSGTLVYGLHLLQQGPEGPLPAARP